MLQSLFLKRSCFAAQLCGQLISDLSQNMSCFADNTAAVIEKCEHSGRYKKLKFLNGWKEGISSGLSPETAFENSAAGLLPEETFEIMKSFAGVIGRYDRENQKAFAEKYRLQLDSVYEKAQAEYADKGKLYRCLGLYIGAVLAVIII